MSSRDVERWLGSLGAEPKRQAKHGTLFTRIRPRCGHHCRIEVPRGKRHITDDTLASICRQAHVTRDGSPRCPAVETSKY